jgi:hypothetical protein
MRMGGTFSEGTVGFLIYVGRVAFETALRVFVTGFIVLGAIALGAWWLGTT